MEEPITSNSKIINLLNEPVVIVEWGFNKKKELDDNYVVFEPCTNVLDIETTQERENVYYIVNEETAKVMLVFCNRRDFIFADGECRDNTNALLGYYSFASCRSWTEPIATYSEL